MLIMKKIAIIENDYVRDTQIFTENPDTIQNDPDWIDKFVDVKYPCQYIGIFEGSDENEIRQKAADNFGIHAGIISLISFEYETDERISQETNPGIIEFEHLKNHVGHKIKTVAYGKKNVTIECADCYEVLYTVDISTTLKKIVESDDTTVINKVFKKGTDNFHL